MPQQVYLGLYLSNFELKKRYQQSKNPIESAKMALTPGKCLKVGQ